MPNLKDIRRRIKTVKSTQKITQAMKMVAAAKVKRAENHVKANRPYADEIRTVFREVYESMKNQASQMSGSRYIELLMDRPMKNVGIVIISSDRGLCGSYNANMLKQALQYDKAYREYGITPKFYLIGNKVNKSFPVYSQAEILGQIGNISALPTFHDALEISKTLTDAFKQGKIDAIRIVYTQFVSMISYKPLLKPIFPIHGIVEEIQHIVPSLDEAFRNNFHKTDLPTRAETLLAPDPVQVLDTLVPLYLSNQIYNALLEGSASELAARMTAMSNASKNAAEMIGKLTISYNKARQASITQELLEIVSGADALS